MSWGAVAAGAVVTVGGLVAGNQERQAAKGAANAQKKAAKNALQEEQRQFDIQNEEYQRKQSMLEDQQKQIITQLAPYVQGGQSAFYQMLALSGLGAPTGTLAQPSSTGSNLSIQSTGAEPVMVDQNKYNQGRGIIGGIMGDISKSAFKDVKGDVMARTVPNAANPYAGMTGQQAQQTAVENIASSPLLQELTRQGEEALLQQSAATGGLRGGNTEAALAQFRPQMLQNEIDKQFARLSGISGTGVQAIGMNPLPNPGGVPTNPNIGRIYQDIGAINAGGLLAEGRANANDIAAIGRGIGYGMGQYQSAGSAPSSTTTVWPGNYPNPTSYVPPNGNIIGYDGNGYPIYQTRN